MTASSDVRLPRWRRWRLGGSHAVTAGCVLFALATLGYLSYRGATGPMRDLQVYRDGGLAIRRGRGLYAMVTSTGLPFTYPPVGAVLAVPLTVVPFALVKAGWATVMVCVPLGVATWFGFRPLLARASHSIGKAAPFALILGGCVLLFPVRQEFYFGQVDVLLVALCLLDLLVRQPKWPRGLLIGLATAIKLEPGVFIVYLLITKRRKEAAVAAASFAAWTALAYLANPHDSVTYWTGAIFQTKRLGGNGSAANQSLRGMIMRAFKPQHAPPAVWITVALIVAVAGFAAARSCWRRGGDTAGITITGLLAAALSPVAWIHHYCWVVVALGVIAGEGRSRRRVAAAVATFALFVTALPVLAQTMIHNGTLPVVPGRMLEDVFGLAALLLIVIIWRLPTTEPLAPERAADPAHPAATLQPSGGEQLPSGGG